MAVMAKLKKICKLYRILSYITVKLNANPNSYFMIWVCYDRVSLQCPKKSLNLILHLSPIPKYFDTSKLGQSLGDYLIIFLPRMYLNLKLTMYTVSKRLWPSLAHAQSPVHAQLYLHADTHASPIISPVF